MTYPIETRARAALRLTADQHKTATDGPLPMSKRRADFMGMHPRVVAIAELAPWRDTDDGEDPRPGYIDALLRIAGVKAQAFERECAAVDAGERKELAAAHVFMAGLRGRPTRRDGRGLTMDAAGGVRLGRMRFTSCSGETDPCLALVVAAEACAGMPMPLGDLCDDAGDWGETG